MRVHVAHSSGQFSDEHDQQVLDAERLCTRAFHNNWWWLTGTEAGPSSSLKYGFHVFGPRNHLTFHKPSRGDVWIVTSDKHFMPGVETEWYKVVDAHSNPHGFNERGILRVTGDTELGQITVLSAHYVTDGAPGDSNEQRIHWNEQLAAKAGELGREFGRGKKLVFYGGDQNIQDRRLDTFLGAPFTSLADETNDYQSTGHGAIDVIASYNHDGRVAGASWKVYDDQEFKLASDHFLCEGVFEIAELRQK